VGSNKQLIVSETFSDNETNIDSIVKAFQILFEKLDEAARKQMAN
jgi:hypothetical protein